MHSRMIQTYINCVAKRRTPTRQPAVAWNCITEKKKRIGGGASSSWIVDERPAGPTHHEPKSAASIVPMTMAELGR